MALLSRSKAVLFKMVDDIKKVLFFVNVFVPIIFFGNYGYSIYKNVHHLAFLIIYSLLFVLSVIAYVHYLATHKKSSKNSKGVKRVIKSFKYLLNAAMIGVKVFEMVKYGLGDFDKILLMISAISLAVQVLIMLVSIYIDNYVKLFSASLEMDLAFFTKLSKLGGVKGAMYELVDAPLEAIANKIENKQPEYTETELYLNELAQKYEAEEAKRKKQKIEEKKKLGEERAENKKQEIVEHLKTIKEKVFHKNAK
ncbi:MAG: hypothetical protein IJV80_03430 [Clostridia bacterium]|nr:hypothetical protein [Clostridia bacterium]